MMASRRRTCCKDKGINKEGGQQKSKSNSKRGRWFSSYLNNELTRATTNACKTNPCSYQPQVREALVRLLINIIDHIHVIYVQPLSYAAKPLFLQWEDCSVCHQCHNMYVIYDIDDKHCSGRTAVFIINVITCMWSMAAYDRGWT
jgi:hypothetical protein